MGFLLHAPPRHSPSPIHYIVSPFVCKINARRLIIFDYFLRLEEKSFSAF
jgi:hypothetical protein